MRKKWQTLSWQSLFFGTFFLLESGCGIEGHFLDLITDEPEVVVTQDSYVDIILDGITEKPEIYLYDLFGNEILSTANTPEILHETKTGYGIDIPATASNGVFRLVAVSGSVVLKKTITCMSEYADSGIIMDKTTTAATLLLEMMGNYSQGKSDNITINSYLLGAISPDEIDFVTKSLEEDILSQAGDSYIFYQGVVDILSQTSESENILSFVKAVSNENLIEESFATEHSINITTFTDNAKKASTTLWTKLNELPIHEYQSGIAYLPVIITAHIGNGAEDGLCNDVDICADKTSINCDEGDSLFFNAGIDPTSPIQSTEINQMLGDWDVNEMPMYDDGTNGDEIAGDNIYTISFYLPETLRIKYKYTWGKIGEGWSGTEEFPGGDRFLEILDNDNNGYVWRDDTVTDESTNKNVSNCSVAGCSGVIEWGITDFDGDGIPETQEHPISGTVDLQTQLFVMNGKCMKENYSTSKTVFPSKVPRAFSQKCE